uniref:hypothetical protein n=1 Tax=Klebsiella pneumoniae TaxID=573 RepID=UPI00195437C7
HDAFPEKNPRIGSACAIVATIDKTRNGSAWSPATGPGEPGTIGPADRLPHHGCNRSPRREDSFGARRMKRLIAFDLDGTLAPSKQMLT